MTLMFSVASVVDVPPGAELVIQPVVDEVRDRFQDCGRKYVGKAESLRQELCQSSSLEG